MLGRVSDTHRRTRKVRRSHSLTFGDAVVKDDSITLRKHKWLGSDEPVRCAWHEVHVWTADGSFYIGAKNDKKTYAALSYIHVPNVHLLERVIRAGFKRGISSTERHSEF
jgi:hypothetical protein